ncbi:HEAT repeat domain-containing protein [Stratiformator vulcanicus]|nr:HEAT repeat domain-containing protein [Stratiformator vulcanicus]
MQLRGEVPTEADRARVDLAGLCRASADPDETRREQAVATIENLGTPQPEAVPVLTPLIGPDEPADSVYWAVTLLGRLGDACPDDAAEAVASALSKTYSMHVRQRAAWALGKIGIRSDSIRESVAAAAKAADSRLARLAERAIDQG